LHSQVVPWLVKKLDKEVAHPNVTSFPSHFCTLFHSPSHKGFQPGSGLAHWVPRSQAPRLPLLHFLQGFQPGQLFSGRFQSGFQPRHSRLPDSQTPSRRPTHTKPPIHFHTKSQSSVNQTPNLWARLSLPLRLPPRPDSQNPNPSLTLSHSPSLPHSSLRLS
jgi:hypothetical protein